MSQDSMQAALESFHPLTDEDKVIVISKLLMYRSDVAKFLGFISLNQLDMLIRSKTLCPPFRGLYLTKEVHSFKNVPLEMPEDLPGRLKRIWEIINQLNNHEQVAFLESMLIRSEEAEDMLRMSKTEVDQLVRRGHVKRFGNGLYFRDSVDKWFRERVKPRLSNSSDDFYIQALQTAAEKLGRSFTKNQYNTWQKENLEFPVAISIIKYFGGWNVGMKKANLVPVRELPNSIRIETDMMLATEGLNLAAKEFREVPTREQYAAWQENHVDYPTVEKIEGIWQTFQRALKKAGLLNNEETKNRRKTESLQSLQQASDYYQGELLTGKMYDAWRKEHPDHLSSIQIIRLWGSWKNAKESAKIL